MRGLFEVFIIDLKTDRLFDRDYYVAASEDQSRLKAVIAAKLVNDVEDYAFICRKVGDLPAKLEREGKGFKE